ncbi:MAG TPA: patatin-like phospholipase family protein, partial [Acidimicrobiia bacterium]|nr:patatin-like phospholipase family protein [Acidimicrobiia bacterium]
MTRIGLVLGAGGAVGHAFHAGVLAALADHTGWDARDAEVVVGTSAGSLVGALLRAGLSPADLAARAGDAPMSEQGRRLVGRAEAATRHLPPIPARAPRTRGVPTMSAPGALVRAAVRPWRARPGALAAAALPAGRIPTEAIASGLRPLFEHWPDRALWINAVDLHTSRRVTFGRSPAPMADVASAVAASCAIPSFFAPVTINGVRYVDGGVHSPTNADLVAGLGLDLVVISSPMSVARNELRFAPDQPARRLSRFALVREAGQIRRGGTPVITFQPTPEDLAVMGLNAMDPSRVADVTRQARASARDRLARSDARERTAMLT